MPVKIFICYAHEDELLLKKLKAYLSSLHRQGLIDIWHDRDISAGTEWEREIDKHLNMADIILLLVSPDFMASDYCYSKEMKRAMERYERGEARVIPVILRPVPDWEKAPFGKLQALPRDAKPITDPTWRKQDAAFSNVSEGIRKLLEQLASDGQRSQLTLRSRAVKMPLLDASVSEGTVVTWHKHEGNWVTKDDLLVEITSGGSNIQLSSPVVGRLAKILVEKDKTVPAGTDIGLIEVDERASPLARQLAREYSIDLNMVTGTGFDGRIRKEDVIASLTKVRSNQ